MTDRGAVGRDADHAHHPDAMGGTRPRFLDIGIAAALALVAALAMAVLPENSHTRLLLALPILFFAPGYLLIQALPMRLTRPWSRVVHGLVAVGVSPALVGVLALGTSLVPGGFRPAVIVSVITISCLALAALGTHRRISSLREARAHAHRAPGHHAETPDPML